jgi:hypothetical protein
VNIDPLGKMSEGWRRDGRGNGRTEPHDRFAAD